MRPRLLDLFCGAGGAAMGYHRAGFEVVGVDIKPQPHYPFEFHQLDMLDLITGLPGEAIRLHASPIFHCDAIHASPPCQGYSISQYMQGTKGGERLIEDVRERLAKLRVPFVIENVPGSPLVNAIELSGMSFGLKIIRRRLFELHGFDILLVPSPRVENDYRKAGYVPYHHGTSIKRGHLPNIWTKSRLQNAMDIDWMNIKELTQAIPPAYTEYIGKELMKSFMREVGQ